MFLSFPILGRALMLALLPLSLFFSLPFSLASAAAASPSPNAAALSLAQAWQLAQAQSPVQKMAAAESTAAQGVLRQSQIWRNPELSYSQERDRGNGERSDTLQLNWPLELGGKRGARTALAQSALVLARLEQEQTELQLQTQVTALFYEALLAQQGAELAEKTLQLTLNVSAATAKKVAAGRLSPVDNSKAQVALSSAQIELAQAQSEALAARAHLAAVIAAEVPPKLQGQASDIPALPVLAPALQNLRDLPAVQRARLQLEQRRAELALARSMAVPDATLSVGSKRNTGQAEGEWIVGLSLPLPFFDRQQGEIAAAISREQAAAAALQLAEQNARASLLQTHARLQAFSSQAQLLQRDALPAAQSAYQATGIGFEYGKFSFLEVLDAQRSLLSVQSQYLRTLGQLQRSAAEWQSLVGRPADSTWTPSQE